MRLPRLARRMLAVSAGFTLLLAGAVMLVLPGPGIPVLVAALVVLAVEFAWAEVWLHRARQHARKASQAGKRLRKRRP